MKAAIVGVTGYSGIELVRLIMGHPQLRLGTIHSHSVYKNSFETHYPHLQGIVDQEILPIDPQQIMAENDLVFFATPAGFSKDNVAAFLEADFPVIDLSGDLRLKDPALYQEWYQKEPAPAEILAAADYLMPEFMAEQRGNLISNPGCYATAAILAAAPLLKKQLAAADSLIFDGKSGLSGAGKNLSDSSHYVSVDENMSMYKLNRHQHIPEITQMLQQWAPDLKAVQFTTSLIPVKRGIFMTLYAKAAPGITEAELLAAYQETYQEATFVRVQPAGQLPQLRQVCGSNYCDIGLGLNEATGIVTVVSVIDNLMKGAAGQAIQNFNIWAGLPQDSGLQQLPLFP